MKINYPVIVDTDEKKLSYLYRMQELLRFEHNNKGTMVKDNKLSKNDWEKYLSDSFLKKQWLIADEIMNIQNNMKKDNSNLADLKHISDK